MAHLSTEKVLYFCDTKYYSMNPTTLAPLTEAQRLALIACFENNVQMQEYPGRRFGLDLGPALEIVKPIIDNVLGIGTWEVAGGNFFETSTGYRVHADTGKDGPEKVLQTFVFPLSMEFKPHIKNPNLEKVRLLILNQVWEGDAAFFLRGSPDEPNEYNIVVRDYKDVKFRDDDGTIDGVLLEQCPHLNPSNFVGLSVDKSFQWIPGVPITFPRNRLHVSSAFPRQGIAKKLGLSIFTSKI
jgi:hypothetical protein